MAEQFLHDLRMLSRGEQDRRAGVSQGMQPDSRQLVAFQ
jgi:hypothetical protein